MTYTKKWRVNDDSLIGTVQVEGVPVAEVGPGKRTITATDANHARLLKDSGRFNPVQAGDAPHPEDPEEMDVPVESNPLVTTETPPAPETPSDENTTSSKAKKAKD